MRFRFRLQKVKDAKGSILDAKKVELARAAGMLKKEEGALASIDEEAGRTVAGINDRWHGPVSIDEVEVYVGYFYSLRARRRHQVERVKEASRFLDRKRQETLCARRDVKILENLYDRQNALFLAEEARKDQIELDEVGLRFHRP